MSNQKEFTLGTANLGMAYGITNKREFDLETSGQIIDLALQAGVGSFDTAPDYGMAELVLGAKIKTHPSVKVVTKIPKMSNYSFQNVYNSLLNSIEKIGVKSLYGILFHDPDAYKIEQLHKLSKKILHTGITEKIGFSAYSVEELIQGKKKNPIWNFFQISENIADQRKFSSSELLNISESGNTIQVRSAFLQGILLLDEEVIKSDFPEYYFVVSHLQKVAKYHQVTTLDLCLSYMNRIPWSHSTIIAANSINQLTDILNYSDIELSYKEFPKLLPQFLDPRKWKK